ncbi:MAG: chitobiase/beta-hexosaminidase C-terminal domain-containing protein, partial [Coriobacteriia bacterium]
GVMQGLGNSVMLLTAGADLHSATRACIEVNRSAIGSVSFLGGTSALSEMVRSQVGTALGTAVTLEPEPEPEPEPAPEPDPSAPHAALKWADYPSNCLSCHPDEFGDAYQGVHYQWQGQAPENVNQPGALQGKLTNAINSYCVSVGDNWQICGKCHAGRGALPVWTQTPTTEQLLNVDCLVCHNDDYSAVRTRRADGSMGPNTTDTALLDSYVRSIAAPTRANCLTCHAYAGGGDAVKRGDLSWATASTTDRNYDVHMATTGADLACQSCHAWSKHKVTGRGSDLRVTDNPGDVTCSTVTCHPGNNVAEHSSAVQNHVARVACQTCHIPAYGRNAADSAATEATEVDRNWLVTNVTGAKPWHPGSTKANNVTPVYEWWNGTNDSMLLGDANLTPEADGTYATSKPVGVVSEVGAKLYPFKYKTATQPMRVANRMLVGIDTFDYMVGSGSPYTATGLGLAKMGFGSTDTVEWVKTSTYQALNHSVPPSTNALQCADCHESTTRIDLTGDLGYALKGPQSTVCVQCHGAEDALSFTTVHQKHSRYDCSFCHTFSRPERGLRTTK